MAKISTFVLSATALTLLAGPAFAQQQTNSAAYNAGYGRVPGQENRMADYSTRDSRGNRVIVDGVMLTGEDQSVFARGGAGGAFDSYSGAGSLGGSTAIGNNLVVITQGSYNTVIIDSTQTNNGDVTAGAGGNSDDD